MRHWNGQTSAPVDAELRCDCGGGSGEEELAFGEDEVPPRDGLAADHEARSARVRGASEGTTPQPSAVPVMACVPQRVRATCGHEAATFKEGEDRVDLERAAGREDDQQPRPHPVDSARCRS